MIEPERDAGEAARIMPVRGVAECLEPTRAAMAAKQLPPPRVLVVEDETDLAKTCERLLARIGYDVICATTVAEGVRRIRDDDLAAVVADLRLPDGSGIDVVFAAQQTRLPIPVIVVTGFLSAASRDAALAAGAAAVLTKPFPARALTDAVSAVARSSPT